MRATKRKSSFTNQLVFLMVVIFFMGSGYGYMHKTDVENYLKNNASYFPFFYSSINDYLSTNINSTHVAKLSSSTASFFPAFINPESNSSLTEKIGSSEITMEATEIITNTNIAIVAHQPPSSSVSNNSIAEKATHENSPLDKEIETVSISNSPSNNYDTNIEIIEPTTYTKRFYLIAGSFSNESNAISLVNDLKKKGFDALIADTNKYGMYRVAFMSVNNRVLAQNKLMAIRNKLNPDAWLLTK